MPHVTRMNIQAAPPESGIYRIACVVTGECYVGSSADMQKRAYQHSTLLAYGDHYSSAMQKAYATHGPASFEFTVMDRCDLAELSDRERAWIGRLSPAFNTSSGGRHANLKPAARKTKKPSASAVSYSVAKLRSDDYQVIQQSAERLPANIVDVFAAMTHLWSGTSEQIQAELIRHVRAGRPRRGRPRLSDAAPVTAA